MKKISCQIHYSINYPSYYSIRLGERSQRRSAKSTIALAGCERQQRYSDGLDGRGDAAAGAKHICCRAQRHVWEKFASAYGRFSAGGHGHCLGTPSPCIGIGISAEPKRQQRSPPTQCSSPTIKSDTQFETNAGTIAGTTRVCSACAIYRRRCKCWCW